MAEYIQTIFNAFTSLNIDTLHHHLKDYHYQDTLKTVFLKELEKIFVNFKHAGDTELFIYEGHCIGKSCSNCGKKGYRFVGNYSKRHLDLIFEIEGDDILDIYNCAKFKSNEKVNKHQFKLEVKIQEDEKLSFIKTPEYLAKLNAATIAWEEIVKTPPRFVNFVELCYWVDKHAVAYDLFEDKEPFDNPMKWSPFLLIYPELNRFKEYLLENIDVIRQANLLIDNIQSEEQLLQWLIKYEDEGSFAPHGLKYSFREKDDHFWWNYYNPIYFQDEVFTEAKQFIDFFQKNYEEMFEKYTTYTNEEASNLYNMCDSKDDTIDLYSLRFHLENRKNIAAMGVNIPFYINSASGEN
jgi:hypothetical protein